MLKINNEMNELPYLITLDSLEIAIDALNSKILYGTAESVESRFKQIEAIEELEELKEKWLTDFNKLQKIEGL